MMIASEIGEKQCESMKTGRIGPVCSDRFAFTLIELLAVIAIISIIASLVVAGARHAQRKAREAKAKADIEHLHNAIEDYRLDIGIYPDSLSNVVDRLSSKADVVDPWDRPYVYKFDPNRNKNVYTLHSEGPNPTITADNIPRR